MSNLQGTPQNAKVALALSNTLVQMPTNVAMPVATAINQLPPQTLGNFSNFLTALASMNFSSLTTVMLSTMIANIAHQASPKMLNSILNTLQGLLSNPEFKAIANDPNKLATLQALLVSVKGKELPEHELLKLIGPLLKVAFGEDDEVTLKEKKEKNAAKERMVEFLDTYVSTAHAIWAEQMNINHEKEKLLELQKKAKQQFRRQKILHDNIKGNQYATT